MILDTLSLTQAITSIESVLKIEYAKDSKLKEITTDAVRRLEDTYGLSINKDIYTLQAENKLMTDVFDRFILEITECVKQFSMYVCLQTYNHSLTFTLSDVNYLGYERNQLMSMLKYLLDKELYPRRTEVVESMKMAIDNIPLNVVKRLFVAMLLLEQLGIVEGVAVIAQLLYMGGIVE